MTESITSERRLTAVEKQRRALELRKAGASYRQIADTLGYRGPSGAFQAIQSALDRMLREPAEAVRKLEDARLDALILALWEQARAGDLPTIDRILKIMQRRAALWGLDMPVEVPHDVTLRIVRVDPTDDARTRPQPDHQLTDTTP